MAPCSPVGPVDCTIGPDLSGLAGKTAVVTGGANGLGEAYVRALIAAEYFNLIGSIGKELITNGTQSVTVVIGDMNDSAGQKLATSLPRTKYVQCDVSKWEDQLHLFEEAVAFSPSGRVHHVVANAGIVGHDDVFVFDGSDKQPQKPNLSTIEVNLLGVLYTTKLAMHYFMTQNGTDASQKQEDTCLLLISSGAGFLDVPRSPQYCSTKWAVRGLMHSLRRTAFHYGSRVNVISPWYVRTSILGGEDFDRVQEAGVDFATVEDAGQCALRILGDQGINGKSLFVCPRKWAPRGYLDLDLDEYRGNPLLEEIQADQVKNAPVELGLFLN